MLDDSRPKVAVESVYTTTEPLRNLANCTVSGSTLQASHHNKEDGPAERISLRPNFRITCALHMLKVVILVAIFCCSVLNLC